MNVQNTIHVKTHNPIQERMAGFAPPPLPSASAQVFASIDAERLIEHVIGATLILTLVFVEDIDLFKHRPSAYIILLALFSLIVGTGTLANTHPPLALLSAILIVAISVVVSMSSEKRDA